MFSLKNNKFKKIIFSLSLLTFILLFNLPLSAKTNPYIEVTYITPNTINNTVTYTIKSNIDSEVLEYGLLVSNSKENMIDNNYLIKCEFKDNLDDSISITISIPKNYFYYNLYTKVYAVTKEEVIYSDEVYYIYADIAGLDKILIKDILYQNNSLSFNIATTLINSGEFGLIFSKNQLIPNLNLENAENDHFETEIIKLDALNTNNEFNVTIKDIPVYELNVTFKACAYTKNNDTKVVTYTKTKEINILEQYYNEIINNLDISYNESYDGIRYYTKTIIPNNKNYIIGFVMLNKEIDDLNINTQNAYIIESKETDSFAVTMNNIPDTFKDKNMYVVSFIKFINENNEYEYYYSDIYKASYFKVKETYLTNNS